MLFLFHRFLINLVDSLECLIDYISFSGSHPISTHIPTHAHTSTRTYMHTYIHTYIHTNIHTNIHTSMHALTFCAPPLCHLFYQSLDVLDLSVIHLSWYERSSKKYRHKIYKSKAEQKTEWTKIEPVKEAARSHTLASPLLTSVVICVP